MKFSLRGTAVLLTITSSIAAAQSGAPKGATAAAPGCDPAASTSIAKAQLYLQRAAQNVRAKQDASKDLKSAITELTTPGKDNSDAVWRDYYLGQAYILLLQQPGVAPSGPRSTYGIATNPTANVDLFAAADSAFTTVETSQPACRTELAPWRQQKPWLDAMNAAITDVNAAKYDSAEYYANRALTIDRRAPYGYTVLAAVASNRKDYPTAEANLQKAIDAAGADTVYGDAKQNAMFDLANAYTLQYDATTGDKSAIGRQAVGAWENYIASGTRDDRVAHAELTADQILQTAKDTAGLLKLYAPIVASPSRYGDQALLRAGIIATQAKRPADAVALFSAVLAHNPNQRDALKNLAASYIGSNQNDKVFPVVDKLISIDPNNADNWLLYAYAYSGMLKNTKDPKLTKAYTDSLVKYNTKSDKLTPNLVIKEFSYGGSDSTATLGGTIENRGTTSQSYTLTVEFLDLSRQRRRDAVNDGGTGRGESDRTIQGDRNWWTHRCLPIQADRVAARRSIWIKLKEDASAGVLFLLSQLQREPRSRRDAISPAKASKSAAKTTADGMCTSRGVECSGVTLALRLTQPVDEIGVGSRIADAGCDRRSWCVGDRGDYVSEPLRAATLQGQRECHHQTCDAATCQQCRRGRRRPAPTRDAVTSPSAGVLQHDAKSCPGANSPRVVERDEAAALSHERTDRRSDQRGRAVDRNSGGVTGRIRPRRIASRHIDTGSDVHEGVDLPATLGKRRDRELGLPARHPLDEHASEDDRIRRCSDGDIIGRADHDARGKPRHQDGESGAPARDRIDDPELIGERRAGRRRRGSGHDRGTGRVRNTLERDGDRRDARRCPGDRRAAAPQRGEPITLRGRRNRIERESN